MFTNVCKEHLVLILTLWSFPNYWHEHNYPTTCHNPLSFCTRKTHVFFNISDATQTTERELNRGGLGATIVSEICRQVQTTLAVTIQTTQHQYAAVQNHVTGGGYNHR